MKKAPWLVVALLVAIANAFVALFRFFMEEGPSYSDSGTSSTDSYSSYGTSQDGHIYADTELALMEYRYEELSSSDQSQHYDDYYDSSYQSDYSDYGGYSGDSWSSWDSGSSSWSTDSSY